MISTNRIAQRRVGLGDAIRNWFPEGSLTFAFSLGATLQVVPALCAVTIDGLFDRFPRLRCFCVEAGAGWAPYIMDRLDEKHQFFAYDNRLRMQPSEYLKRNVWYCAEPTERTINATMDLVGETQVVWGSDYPHIDSHIEAATQIRASVAGLSEQRRRLVLGENAQNLFRL